VPFYLLIILLLKYISLIPRVLNTKHKFKNRVIFLMLLKTIIQYLFFINVISFPKFLQWKRRCLWS
jgi:hypothetical protein